MGAVKDELLRMAEEIAAFTGISVDNAMTLILNARKALAAFGIHDG